MKKKLAGLDLRLQVGLVAFGLIILAAAGYLLVVSPRERPGREGAVADRCAEHPDLPAESGGSRGAPPADDRDRGPVPARPRDAGSRGHAGHHPGAQRDRPGGRDHVQPDRARRRRGPTGARRPVHAAAHAPALQRRLLRPERLPLSPAQPRRRARRQARGDGRLFNVDTVTFNVLANSFPQISAELYIDAYVYAGAPAASSSSSPTTTTGTSTTPSTTTTRRHPTRRCRIPPPRPERIPSHGREETRRSDQAAREARKDRGRYRLCALPGRRRSSRSPR